MDKWIMIITTAEDMWRNSRECTIARALTEFRPELRTELKKAGLDLPDGILTIEEFVESMAKLKGR